MKYKVGDRVQIYDLETWGEVEVEIVKVNKNSYRCTDGRTVWPEVQEDYIEKFISSGKKIEKGCPFDEPGYFNPNPPKQEPDYRALYEQEKAMREALVDEIINYITKESEIPIPVNRFFHADGTHITQKEYGIILLEILCDELRNKFKPTTNN